MSLLAADRLIHARHGASSQHVNYQKVDRFIKLQWLIWGKRVILLGV